MISKQLTCFGAATVMVAGAAIATAQVVEIKAYGRPAKAGKVKGPHYAVWFDEEGWHVRSETGGNPHRFEGTIEVEGGGKITKVLNFESFEATPRKKKGKIADSGRVADDDKRITFRTRSGGKGDTFGFHVSEGATKLRFRLQIDGDARPDRVLIGEGSQPAPSSEFELDAHPKR